MDFITDETERKLFESWKQDDVHCYRFKILNAAAEQWVHNRNVKTIVLPAVDSAAEYIFHAGYCMNKQVNKQGNEKA
jgi:hypothetical protein